jgi:MFS family permease
MTAAAGEFRRGWPVVAAAAAGSGLGIAGLLTYTAGIFGAELQRTIGLSRSGLGLGLFLSTLTLTVALPFAGRLIDRHGNRGPAVAGAIGLAAGFTLLGTVVASVPGYLALMAAIGLIAATSSPIAYTRAVSGAFAAQRGLALGLMQLGIGVAAMIVPPLVAGAIGGGTWRTAYLLLAGLALCGTIPALLLPRQIAPAQEQAPAGRLTGEAARVFRLQLAAFALMGLAFVGIVAHFVPMLREAGYSGPGAAGLVSLIGLSVIVTRIIVGWLADRMEAPRIAAATCAICAAGCLLLAWGGAPVAWVGAIAVGAALGAEADLIGFLTARYFDLASYGRLYAAQYAAFTLAAGASPLWIGLLADRSGGYALPLIVAAAGLIGAIPLFLALPSTRRAADPFRPSPRVGPA